MILLALSALLCSSCKEVDQPTNSNQSQESLEDWIVGTWTLTEISQQNGTISVNGFQTSTFTATGEDVTGMITFTDSPKSYSNISSYNSVMTIVIAGQTTTQTIPIAGTGSGTWSLDTDENIVLSSSGKDETFEVLESSENRIKVKFPFEQSETTGPVTTLTKAEVIAVYQK